MEAIGIGGEENAGKRLTVLRAIDKLDRLGRDAVKLLLGPGRKDDSGDFTKGAGLDPVQSEFLLAVIEHQPFVAVSKSIETNALSNAIESNETANSGFRELDDIHALISAAGYGPDRVRIDPSVVRGLEYYTGPVYEVELLLETKDEHGRPVRFGSVGGGGRYDGLVSRFRGEPVPATGFSIGVSRLQAALSLIGRLETKPEPGPVVVTVFDRDRIADYQRMVAALRNAGIRAEMYLGSGKFGPQMKYADRRNSPCVVIQGGDEKARGEVQVKDLILGATLSGTKDRDEYLKKQAEAQFAVPRTGSSRRCGRARAPRHRPVLTDRPEADSNFLPTL